MKSRLAASVGEANAERFYRLCVRAIEATVRSLGPVAVVPYWAVAEGEAVDDPVWGAFERVPQGNGGLGERLDFVYRTLLDRHPVVLLIGADAPLITSESLELAAAVKQNSPPFALSRSHDGGYAIFAGSKPLPKEVWTSVPYSCGRTADEFEALLRPYGEVADLPQIDDVDTAADLTRLVSASAGIALSPEQAAIVAFARELLILTGDD